MCRVCVCVLPAPFNLTDTGCPRLFPDWPGASDFLEKFLLFYWEQLRKQDPGPGYVPVLLLGISADRETSACVCTMDNISPSLCLFLLYAEPWLTLRSPISTHHPWSSHPSPLPYSSVRWIDCLASGYPRGGFLMVSHSLWQMASSVTGQRDSMQFFLSLSPPVRGPGPQ